MADTQVTAIDKANDIPTNGAVGDAETLGKSRLKRSTPPFPA
jgi:hypothetical protein